MLFRCDKFNACLACENGYNFNSSTNSCEKCTIPFSLNCSSLTKVNSCIDGFVISQD